MISLDQLAFAIRLCKSLQVISENDARHPDKFSDWRCQLIPIVTEEMLILYIIH